MPDNEFEQLVAGYVDNRLSQAETARLKSLLEESPERRREAAAALSMHRILRESDVAVSSVNMIMNALPASIVHDTASPVIEQIRKIEGDAASLVSHKPQSSVRKQRQRRRRQPVVAQHRPFILRFAPYLAACIVVAAVSVWLYQSTPTGNQIAPRVTRVIGDASGTVKEGDRVDLPAKIGTGPDSSVELTYPDGTRLIVQANSSVDLREGSTIQLKLNTGSLWADVAPQPSQAPLRIVTPHAVATVLGTSFDIYAEVDHTRLQMTRGKVRFMRSSDRRAVVVVAGQSVDSKTMDVKQTLSATEKKEHYEFVVGINLSGKSVRIDGRRWLSQKNAEAKGLRLLPEKAVLHAENPTLSADNDANLVELLNTNAWVSFDDMTLTYPLANGEYRVWIWVAENYETHKRKFDVHIEGRVAERNVGYLQKGEWRKHGPYRVTVADGELTMLLESVVDSPHIAGIMIERVKRE